jgi:hypothetical protein
MPDDLTAAVADVGPNLNVTPVPGLTMFNVIRHGSIDSQTRVLMHLILSSDLSVEIRWREVEIIEKVLRRFPCRLICSEGGSKDCSLSPMKQIASTEGWQTPGIRFFHSLELGSEEFLQLTTDFDYRIQGVDDMAVLSEAHVQKRAGKSGLELAASVKRAQTILTGTLAHMDSAGQSCVLLITQELPAYQIGVLLGGPRADLMEELLPETVGSDLVTRDPSLLYVPLQTGEPQGDVFDMDINYQHSVIK